MRPNKRQSSASEHQIQSAFIQGLGYLENLHPQLALSFAVPNGGLRNVITAAKLKREGVRAGVPDWVLPWPCGAFKGLMIEFKSETGRTRAEQKGYISSAKAWGLRVEVCKDAEKAMQIVREYLEGA